MLKYPVHDSFRRYIRELNMIYLEYNALHYDYDPTNFMWDDCKSPDRCVYALRRKSKDGDILAVLNLSDWFQGNYTVKIGEGFNVKLLLDSDCQLYNGRTPEGKTVYNAHEDMITMDIPPYSGFIFLLSR